MNVSHFVKKSVRYQRFYINLSVGVSLILENGVLKSNRKSYALY